MAAMSAASHVNSHSGGPMGRALVPFVPAQDGGGGARGRGRPSLRHGLLVVSFGLAVGAGVAGFGTARHLVTAWTGHRPGPEVAQAQSVALSRLQSEVGRLQGSVDALRAVAENARADDQLRSLKRSIDALKQNIEQVQSAGTASAAELAARLDKADRDPPTRLAEIASRLDRIEKQVALANVPPAPRPAAAPGVSSQGMAAAPSQPAATLAADVPTPPAKPAAAEIAVAGRSEVTQLPGSGKAAVAAKPPTIANWVLRDVYDGMALVQARGGGVREVEPGEYLPGAGQVRSIERHGRNWVIMTSRGVIEAAAY